MKIQYIFGFSNFMTYCR